MELQALCGSKAVDDTSTDKSFARSSKAKTAVTLCCQKSHTIFVNEDEYGPAKQLADFFNNLWSKTLSDSSDTKGQVFEIFASGEL